MGALTATITSEGSEIPAEHTLMSIEVSKSFNRVPYAELVYRDGDSAKGHFPVSGSKHFDLDKKVVVKLRGAGEDSDKTIFEGIVVNHRVSASIEFSKLSVELKGSAQNLTLVRNSQVFSEKQSEKQIIEKVLGGRMGSFKGIEKFVEHEGMSQCQATDWDFVLSRAQANGWLLEVAEDGDKVDLVELGPAGRPQHRFEFGGPGTEAVLFELEMEASRPAAEKVEAVAWSPASQKPVPENAGDAAGAGAEQSALLRVESLVPLSEDERSAWSAARLAQMELATRRGAIQIAGNTDVKLGDWVKVTGVSHLFSDPLVVSGICHQVTVEDGWRTTLQFGLSDGWLTDGAGSGVGSGELGGGSAGASLVPDPVSPPPAGGLLPAISGLHIGQVVKLANGENQEAPDDQFRVIVKSPTMGDKEIYARLAMFDAGKDRGAWFAPQPDDEVVLGFLNDDPRFPVILGSLYSSTRPVPVEEADKLDALNNQRVLKTPAGHSIEFSDDPESKSLAVKTSDGYRLDLDDKNETLQLLSKKGHYALLNDADQFVEITTAGGRKIELNDLDGGVKIESLGDLTIDTGGNSLILKGKFDQQ